MKQNKNKKDPYKKVYELSFENNAVKYIVILSRTKKRKLKIKISDNTQYHLIYLSEFSYKNLTNISKFFLLFQDIEEIITELDMLFTEENVLLTLDMEHNIVIKFNVELNTKKSYVLLKIENQSVKKLKEVGEMYKIIDSQKQEIQDLKNENKNLKRQIRANKNNESEEESEKSSKTKKTIPSKKPEIEKKEEPKKEEEKKPEEEKKEEPKKPEEDNLSKDKKTDKELNMSEIKADLKSNKKDADSSVISISKTHISDVTEINYSKIISRSGIFTQEREITFLIDKINKNLNYRNKKFFSMKLIYKASEDGDTPYKFHKLCDGLCPLIVLVKTTYNKRFGGFTEAYFEASDELIGKYSNTAFIFNLDREKAFDIIEGQSAICCHKSYGPVFYGYEYCNIYLVGNFLSNEGNVARKGDRYKTTFDYEINDGRQKFVAQEVEIYHVTLKKVENLMKNMI